MNRPRYQLLPGTGFSQDADSRLAARYPLNLRHHALHGGTLPHQFMLSQPLLELPVLAFEPLQLQCILHGQQKFFRGDGFLQKVQRPQPCCSKPGPLSATSISALPLSYH